MKLSKLFASMLILALMLSVLPAQFAGAATSELFFSEYIEGSSFDKALEIYNGTGAAVDLAAGGYTVQFSFNGGTSTASYALTGMVANDDVYVVTATNVSATLAAYADQQFGTAWFNGDDAVVLWKGGVGGTIVDVFGQVGFDPGAEWAGGGQDDTLRRLDTICAGDTNPNDAFDASLEWVVYPINTFDGLGSHTANCGGTTTVEPKINEFSASTTGTDVEYVEIFGEPNTDYSAYTVLEIEGDGSGAGYVDEVISLGTTDASGFYLADLPANALENGTVSLLLVKNFTGVLGDDLDTDNDGNFDTTPWDAIVDGVSVNDGGSGDLTYGVPALGPNYDGVSSFAPGGASRIPDGFDTDTASDWVRNDFDLAGIPGFLGTIAVGEAYNTPGAPNEIYVPPPEMCGDPFTPIYDVQGNGSASPLVGTEVAIEGVVVGDFQNNASEDNGDLNGFHVQDPTGDADAATSDGVFVYAPGGMDVSVGDAVRVRGSVSEYFGLTEISASQIWNCGTGSVSPTEISLPVTNEDDFEAYEGMLVTFPQPLVISEYYNFDRFGEIVLTSRRHLTPTAEFEPGSPEEMQAVQDYLLDRITLDDGRGNQNPDPAIHPNGMEFTLDNLFRGGDTVANVTGVMDYAFGLYRIQPTQGADYTNTNPRTAQPDDVGGNVKVASFNVLNYFTTIDFIQDDSGPNDPADDVCGPEADQECRGADNENEFERQRAKIIAALTEIDADVVGLIEIENYPGDVPTADLVSGLNDAMGAGTYDYIATGAIGTDAIRVAFIYKPASVSPVGSFAVLDSSVDSRFNDEKNRPALAQTFVNNATGGVFTAVVNHLKSKGSACDDVGDPDTGDGAGNCNLTRKAAAEALVDWLASDPTGIGDGDFLIMGDLNSYDKEEPIDAIKAGPDDTPDTADDYTDMVYHFQGEDAYSYVFDGQTGYLDHALANADMFSETTGVTIWHINADEADLIDYDTSFKGPNQDAIYAPDAYRSSDHDPVIVGLELTTEQQINELIDMVQLLVDDGALNDGQGNALISKLENVLDKLARGNTNAAANQLGAFINQVEDFIDEGVLTAEQGNPLIKVATALVEALSN
jgi:predicted extracellular nuclease